MTESAQKILEFARKYDLAFDAEDAQLYVDHKAAIARNPKDPEQVLLAKHFESVFHFAKDEIKLEDFIDDPQCPSGCHFCRAHDERYARRTSERFNGLKI